MNNEDVILLKSEKESYSNIIKRNIIDCTEELGEISEIMEEIELQGGWDSFWKKSNNIRLLSKHVGRVTNVQQKTLDLIVLLMSGTSNVKSDYNRIISTIDNLSNANEDNIEILKYLIKMKETVKSIQASEKKRIRNSIIAKAALGFSIINLALLIFIIIGR